MLYKFKYPKLSLLIIAITLAYFLFRNPAISDFVSGLDKFRYFGIFIAGLLFPLGFTAPFSVGFFITLNVENIVLSGIVGGAGAMITNVIIFSFIRFSFKEEIMCLEKTLSNDCSVNKVKRSMNKMLNKKIKDYIKYIFIGLIIASPIPDEFADIIIAGMGKVKVWALAFWSFVLTSIGIIILLNI